MTKYIQSSFDEMLESEKRKYELTLPDYLQTASAPLLRYIGESKTGLPHGVIGFIVGTGFGNSNNTKFRWRSGEKEVSLLDLKPVKVTDFTEEEREMKYPERFDLIEIVANSTMKVIDKGYLLYLTPSSVVIVDKCDSRGFTYKREIETLVNHIKGYKPKRLLVWREEIESNGTTK